MSEPPALNVEEELGLTHNPVITGLWQVADLERGGTELDRQAAADVLLEYVADGFHCFDMADHYGSAELIAGHALAQLKNQSDSPTSPMHVYTKWCPQPHEHTFEAVRAGIEQRRQRLGVETIDLLQLHWWHFDHPGYIDVMDHLTRLRQQGWIKHIGLTNFDTDHLRVLLSCGFEILTNQVCISVLDRRALQDMSELCLKHGVRLLAYGSLAGGFLSDRWLNKPEPVDVPDWSKMKYQRFIASIGGWESYQRVLLALDVIARRHGVSISNVAARWVLQQPAVAGVIVGARITERQHRDQNKTLLSFSLHEQDFKTLDTASEDLLPIPGDCGTEYRRPPFLTASGDLSHHLDALPKVYVKEPVPGRTNRWRITSGSEHEAACGYSRATRDGNRVLVSGTTATHGADRCIGLDDVGAQSVYILDKISASLESLGASLDDVVRTRIYMTDCSQWEAVAKVHGRYFGRTMPSNTLIEVSNLVGPYTVEIEAEAVI